MKVIPQTRRVHYFAYPLFFFFLFLFFIKHITGNKLRIYEDVKRTQLHMKYKSYIDFIFVLKRHIWLY